MKLVKNDMYLFLIDEKREIVKNDFTYIESIYGRKILFGKVLQVTDSTLTLSFDDGYHVDDYEKEGKSVIIAYYPLTKEAKYLDLLLLPNPLVDLNIQTRNFNKQVKNPYSNWDMEYQVWEKAYIEGFNDGVAQSKQFNIEELKKAIEIAQTPIETGIGDYYPNANETIESLSTTQQFPIGFEPDYVYNPTSCLCDNTPCQCNSSNGFLKRIINSDGEEEIQGKYKY